MAVMASPQSERATLDQKPAESTPAKEDTKAETNGHASPSEAPVESEKPTVNGNGKHDGENKDTDDADTTATKEPEPSPQESPAKPDESAEEPKTVKSDDASKDEAKTDDPKDDSKVEPKEEPKAELEGAKDDAKDEKESSKPPSPKSAEPPKDVEMTDAAEEKPDDKPETTAEEKAAEASEPAKSATDAKEDVEMGQDDEKVNGAKTEAESPALSAVAGQEVDLHPASMSQLAIDKNEEKSSAPKDADVPMADAPAPAAKVSREREEDVADEPAPKRAKTESNADSQEAPAADSTVEVKPPGDTGKSEFSFDDLPRWNDPERDPKPLTPHQIREFRKVLAGVKKTKHGAHFKEPVVKLWPGLADSYMMRIKKPMDIGELERNLRDNKYSSLRSFKDDLALVYNNSVAFNGPTNEFTKAALSVVKLAWTRVADIPVDEPAKSKPVPKPSRHSHSESRTSAPTPPVRRQPSVHAASPPAKAETEAYAVPPGGVPQVRRASTQNDLDRPKRAIQPTKNRDPDYSAKNFNKKKLPIELQFCYEVLTELMDSKNAHCNMPFLYPVDPVALAIPTYFTIIKRPMDLGTIMSKLKNYDYQTTKEFRVDVKQVFKNCYKFNGPGQPVYEQGEQLEKIFGELWSKKDQWIAKHTPAKPTSDGSARDSEDEAEEEEEEAPAAAAAPQTNKTIQMLEKRLQEETEELTNLYKTADASSDAMIDLQQSVIATIRQRILQEKQNLPQGQKPLKNAKPKPAKPTKPKASAAPTKKSAPAAPPKKSGGGGSKKAKLRNMTQPEKDAIANAINDLESPHIERAIDIIKKDTGQSENSSGELELEIDQLTNEALHKLWDLCKKALPTFAQGIAPAPSAREPSPVHSAPAKGAAKSSKPKKNKPMNAIEQEARIAELERLRHMYGKGGSDDGNERPGSSGRADEAPIHGDSESSDSEEE